MHALGEDLSDEERSLTMRPMPWTLLRSLRRVAATAAAACITVAAYAQPTDADFAAARDAYRAGDAARLERLAPRLAGYLLEPYVAYWRLRLKLDDADPAAVRGFLDRYAELPLAGRLRSEWLKALGKRGDWTVFAAEYPKRTAEDVELACYAAQFRAQRKDLAEGEGATDGEAVLVQRAGTTRIVSAGVCLVARTRRVDGARRLDPFPAGA